MDYLSGKFKLALLSCTGSLTLFPGACMNGSEETIKNPNIILFLADDLGYNDISHYRKMNGSDVAEPPTCQTPNIDKLAAEGIAFTDFYAGAAVCSPSRAALLSGRNATRTGIYNWIPAGSPMHFRTGELTIAEMLKEQEYQTAHFGKWHLTSSFDSQPGPLEQGFDYGLYTQNNAEPSHHNPVNFIRNGVPLGSLEGYASHLVIDEAIGWLKNNLQPEYPFYLNVWFHEPHVVCAAPEEFTSRHTYNKQYYGSIENMDAAIGKLMSFLKDTGLEENTLIIFTSDNGSQVKYSNLPFNGEKCLNIEGGVRVPFIARWKEKIPEGQLTSAIGNFTDVLPTLAELTGASTPDNRILDGESLATVFQNPETGFIRETPVFFYRYFHDPICMLREGDWILTGYDELFDHTKRVNLQLHAKFRPAPEEPRWSQWSFQESHMKTIPNQEPQHYKLHNIAVDPKQENNLADVNPQILNRMKEKMLTLRREMIEEGGNWFQN
jgi:arylsulfatase A